MVAGNPSGAGLRTGARRPDCTKYTVTTERFCPAPLVAPLGVPAAGSGTGSLWPLTPQASSSRVADAATTSRPRFTPLPPAPAVWAG